MSLSSGEVVEESIQVAPPIADMFSRTTILFCHKVGFTKWSTGQSPEDIFTLLETIYKEFDHIAKKYRVYKLETIHNDVYIAVIALPEPRADHTDGMEYFTLECYNTISNLFHDLVNKLEPETLSLHICTGLHSGAIIGGILGLKKQSRFNLYGDTINTASQMASTGELGMIQFST